MLVLLRVIGGLLFLSFVLAGCGEDVVLPPAEPLAATESELEQIYGISPGAYPVRAVRDLVIDDSARERELEVSVFYPEGKEQFPLLLFSHGNWSDKDSYDRVIDHWVSHGYIVIAPNHFDCCGAVSGIFNSVRYGQLGLIDEALIRRFELRLEFHNPDAKYLDELYDKLISKYPVEYQKVNRVYDISFAEAETVVMQDVKENIIQSELLKKGQKTQQDKLHVICEN